MKSLAAFVLLLAFQGRTLYEDPTRSIRVYGYTQAEGGTTESGDFEFSMQGRPAVVESRLEGMKVTGANMSGVVAPATLTARAFIRNLKVDGGSTISLDSDMAYQAQSDLAKRLGTQAPALPTSHDIATIASAQFEYSGSATQGTLTLLQPFAVESKSVGKSGDKSFDQTMTAEGSQATIQLDPASAGKVPFQTGKISGPVKLKILRSETAGTQPPTLSELNGSADMVEFDLTTSRTITLKGNVKVSGSSGLYQGTSEGDTVVVSLDENMKPIKIRITGDPTKSTLRERKPGGGR